MVRPHVSCLLTLDIYSIALFAGLSTSFSLFASPLFWLLFVHFYSRFFITLTLSDPEVPKGVRATIPHHEHEILYEISLYHYHEKIRRQFDTWINNALGNMGLSFLNYDFWLGATGRSTGRVCSNETEPPSSKNVLRGSPI